MPTILQRVRGIVGATLYADVVAQNIEKAIEDAQKRAEAYASQPTSMFYDPYSIFMGREWLQRRSTALTYYDLRMMARNPIIASIIGTRLAQVAAFCQPTVGMYQPGFKVVDISKEMKGNDNDLKDMERWVATAGLEGYGESGLEDFARKYLSDSLTLDQANAEIIPDRRGLPAYWVAVDAASIRKLRGAVDWETPEEEPIFCQIYQEQVVTTYLKDQMMFGIRNPQTNLYANGYGQSELEVLIAIVTSLTNADKLNSQAVVQGAVRKGVLVVKGEAESLEFEAFKRDFREAVATAAHVWRPPVIRIGSDAQVDWVALDAFNKDMEFSQLYDFIVKIAAAVYNMDPLEINWTIGQAGQTGISFNSGASDKIAFSREKGLRPLMVFFANQININILQKFNENYRLAWTGFENNRSADLDMAVKEVQNFKTVNEVRKDAGLDPVEGGDIILNNTIAPIMAALQGLPTQNQPQNGGQNGSQGDGQDEAWGGTDSYQNGDNEETYADLTQALKGGKIRPRALKLSWGDRLDDQ